MVGGAAGEGMVAEERVVPVVAGERGAAEEELAGGDEAGWAAA